MSFGNDAETIPRARRSAGTPRACRVLAVLLLAFASVCPEAHAYPSRVQVFVANSGSDNVTVYDTRMQQVVATVRVGHSPVGVGAAPDGDRVYVTNELSDTVSVIDAHTYSTVATVPVGLHPFGVAVAGSHAYVTNFGADTVSVLDTAANTVVGEIPVGRFPHSPAASPDRRRVYVTDNGAATVSVIDVASDQVVATLPVGRFPAGIAVSPAGDRVYVAATGANSVNAISASGPTLMTTQPVGQVPMGIAVTPRGQVYVANAGSGTVTVLGRNQPVSIPVQNEPEGVAAAPDSSYVFVTNSASGSMSVIDIATTPSSRPCPWAANRKVWLSLRDPRSRETDN
ncbi:beta-propeller fold lactonase family protein [Amycolatopsis sp. lyj-23]|uniref:beta-propeller fold lactonase family protein n=1 Tax=Amycolatopsis sp. lyj-23 TaxID=2789283 RepID=UPI00397C6C95